MEGARPVDPGEVEEFAYCAHAWHLGRRRPRPGKGIGELEKHRRIGGLLHRGRKHGRQARDLLAWSFRILGVAAATVLVTLHTVFFRDTLLSYAYVAISLVLLQCSAGLLTLSLYEDKKAKQIRDTLGLAPAELTPERLAQRERTVEDPQTGLRGPVGNLLYLGDRAVPIHVVAEDAPRRAHPWHQVRVACHLRLLEVRDDEPPEYGLVAYDDGIFRVAWDEATRALLGDNMERLRQTEPAPHVPRSHEARRRCIECVWRPSCDQTLA